MTALIVLLLLPALAGGLFYIGCWNLCEASRQSVEIKCEATSENTLTVHKIFIVTENRWDKILMREFEIGLIAKLLKFM